MIRDPALGSVWLETEREPANLAPVAACCNFRHLPGDKCLLVRILPPGEADAGKRFDDYRLKGARGGRRTGMASREASGTRKAVRSRRRARAAYSVRAGEGLSDASPRLRLCPDCRRFKLMPAGHHKEPTWRCDDCRLKPGPRRLQKAAARAWRARLKRARPTVALP